MSLYHAFYSFLKHGINVIQEVMLIKGWLPSESKITILVEAGVLLDSEYLVAMGDIDEKLR